MLELFHLIHKICLVYQLRILERSTLAFYFFIECVLETDIWLNILSLNEFLELNSSLKIDCIYKYVSILGKEEHFDLVVKF